MINGVTQLFMMKADVLSGFDEIKVCTHYECEDGTTTDKLTYEGLEGSVKPVYKSFKGWDDDLRKCHTFEELPEALIDYISYIESEVNVPVNIVSTGPDRTETIIREAVSV